MATADRQRLVILGPPGAGKTTQAEKISAMLNIPLIESGDLIREEIREGTDLGQEIEDMVQQGDLVPDRLVNRIVGKNLGRKFVLSGFPRTVEQAKYLKERSDVDLALYLDVTEKVAVSRLSERRYCPQCGESYHLKFKPPEKDEICDKDGTELKQRKDDKPEVIKKRFREYREKTEPILDFYRKQGMLKEIDGEKDIETVFQKIKKVIESG